MFGKGLLKLIGLALAGAIALAGGAQILSSVATVVIATRSGNVIPLAASIIITLLLIRIKRALDDHPLNAVLGVVGYAAVGYLAVVAFVWLLPFGLIASLLGAAVTITSLSIIHDPSQLKTWTSSLAMDSPIKWGFSISKGNDVFGSAIEIEHQILILPENSRDQVFVLMRARPLLPISLMHLDDIDVLCISKSENRTISESVKDIIAQNGIQPFAEVSPFLREILLKIPLIDSQNGLAFTDYVLVRDKDALSHILETAPSRMRVFPSKTGLRVLYPESEAPGLVSENVADNMLASAILFHDYTGLQEVKESENTP